MPKPMKPEPESESSILKRGAVIGMYKLLLQMALRSPALTEAERKFLTVNGPASMTMRAYALNPDNSSRRGDLMEVAGKAQQAHLENLMDSGCAPQRARALCEIFSGSHWPEIGSASRQVLCSSIESLQGLFPGNNLVLSACYAALQDM